MKKLAILATVMCVAFMSQAASFKWTAGNIYGSDGTTKWAGDVSLYAYAYGADAATAVLVDTATPVSGTIANKAFTWNDAVTDKGYNFYFVIEDGGKAFTSATKENMIALESQTQSIGFGNMQGATQNASNWQTIPEPTSGLLMLLGVAGLALRRRRA